METIFTAFVVILDRHGSTLAAIVNIKIDGDEAPGFFP